jgi:hypothetical protein
VDYRCIDEDNPFASFLWLPQDGWTSWSSPLLSSGPGESLDSFIMCSAPSRLLDPPTRPANLKVKVDIVQVAEVLVELAANAANAIHVVGQ